eukprot:229443_1
MFMLNRITKIIADGLNDDDDGLDDGDCNRNVLDVHALFRELPVGYKAEIRTDGTTIIENTGASCNGVDGYHHFKLLNTETICICWCSKCGENKEIKMKKEATSCLITSCFEATENAISNMIHIAKRFLRHVVVLHSKVIKYILRANIIAFTHFTLFN